MDSIPFMFALALVGLILFAVGVVQSRFASVVAWGGVAVSAALALFLNTQM